MARSPSPLAPDFLKRALAAVLAGLPVERIKIGPDGSLELFAAGDKGHGEPIEAREAGAGWEDL